MKCTVRCVVEYNYTIEIPEDAITEDMETFETTRDVSVSKLAEVYNDVDDEVFDALSHWNKCFDYAYTAIEVCDEEYNTVFSYSE